MVPRLCALDSLPVTTSGKVDKRALPWPLPSQGDAHFDNDTQEWLAGLWADALGASVTSPDADFFTLGGTSLGAATMIGRVRETVPTVSVRDLYDHSRLAAFAEHVQSLAPTKEEQEQAAQNTRDVRPVGFGTRLAQALIQVPAMSLAGFQWVTWLLVGNAVLGSMGVAQAVDVPLWLVIASVIIFATPLGRMPVAAVLIRLLTAGLKPGTYPRGGAKHLRVWAAERIADTSGARDVSGAAFIHMFARALGAKVGRGVAMHTLPPVTGMLSVGNHATIEQEVDLRGYWVDGDQVHIGRIDIGEGASIGARSTLFPGTRVGTNAHVEPGSAVTARKKIKSGARWSGSPAVKVGKARGRFPDEAPPRRPAWVGVYALSSVVLSLLPLVAVGAGIAAALGALKAMPDATLPLYILVPLLAAPAGLVAFATYTALTWILVRILQIGLKPGIVPVRSAQGWRLWSIERLMDAARIHLFPMYAGQITTLWFRSLGAKVGKDAEISTAVMVPRFAEVKEGAFLADDTMVAGYELGGGGWMLSGNTRVGKRSFLGNSGIAGPERNLKKNSLVAVLSSTPKKTKSGSNWIGSPPERMRRVEVESDGRNRTYNPSLGLKLARGFVETLRLTAPMVSAMLAGGVLLTLQAVLRAFGPWITFAVSGAVLVAAGFLAVVVTVLVKWLCVGRIKKGDHVLWSGFVWLNELQDQFVETVAGPWFLAHTLGTGSLNLFLRGLGAKIGRGAWLESYWLPEADLVQIGRGASVGPGCVVQTHLFQDRVMSLDSVTLGDGATMGPHSVALPASVLSDGATVGPASLVMRGDMVPRNSRWQGNPIEVWKS